MSQHIGPRTISATGGSIKRVGNYRIHTFPSELITDGLVFNLDAGDPRSYPGSGTVWTDLSGNGNTGTLTNGPTYSNANGGSIVFDGVNDYVSIPVPSQTVSNFTMSVWVKSTNSADLRMAFTHGTSTSNFLGIQVGLQGWIYAGSTNIYRNYSSVAPAVDITNLVLIYQGSSNSISIYKNGLIQDLSSSVGTVPATITLSNFYLGMYLVGNTITQPMTGNIYSASAYNRALSAAEVAQNYDALKVRYSGYTNTFTPLCAGGSGKVEVLCVAGGGGGGEGGGGAGGLLYNSAFTVNSNTGIGLTVGAGGTGSNGYLSGKGSNGGNSLFSTLTSIGGGAGGAGNPPTIGNTGGSGGGTSAAFGALATSPAAGTVGQGYSGGAQSFGSGSLYASGGGGGAGGNGGIGNTSAVGGSTGGVGLSYAISGISQFYAGGGGGNYYISQFYAGLGGSGVGGGSGIATTIGTNAIPNTGSGGGGSAYNVSISGNGSNGIVIVRYPATDYNVELLIVGGGGAGGGSIYSFGGGAGGGAGGLIYYSSYPVSAGTKYTVNVGAGGTGQNATTGANGSNGDNSIFGPLVAFGGGGGSNGNGGGTGSNGGSGGGGGYRGYTTVANGGFGVAGQGNNGGGVSSVSAAGAGGGGAGGVGQSNTGSGGGTGGIGGVGLTYAITGSSVTYATGGQGGAASGTTGSANTGNGGAGTYADANTNTAYAGGSGIIIIAYQGPQRGIGGTVNTTSRPGYTLHTFTTIGTDFFIP